VFIMRRWFRALWSGEDGAAANDSALLVSLIAGVAGTVRVLGQGLSGAFGSVLTGL